MSERHSTLAPLLDWRSAVLSPGNGLSAQEKLVGLALCQYANAKTAQAFPGQENLSQDASVSLSTVKRSLRRLIELGYVREHKPARQGRGKATVYEITLPGEAILAHQKRVSQVHPSAKRVSESVEKGVTQTPQQVVTSKRGDKSPLGAASGDRQEQGEPSAYKLELGALVSALCLAVGDNEEELLPARRRRYFQEATPLLKAKATPLEVEARADAYRKTYPNAALTLEALVKHWAALGSSSSSGSGSSPRRSIERMRQVVTRWATVGGGAVADDEADLRSVYPPAWREQYGEELLEVAVQAFRQARAA